jgi:hypothetical protein
MHIRLLPSILIPICLVQYLLLAGACPAFGEVLFFDDFSGTSLNTTNWSTGTWQLGRTQLGNTPSLNSGVASLSLNAYNASNTNLIRGTEIFTNQSFAIGSQGIEFEARIRTNMTSGGAVTAFFT